jgi:transcription antitermination factor NusG
MMLDPKPLTRIEAPQASIKHAACGRYWGAIQTHPQAENWACSNLRRAGYPVYLPTLFISRRDRHTPTIVHRVERPLFSSYLFVHIGDADPWTPIRYASGVRQILMSSGKPAPVPETVINALQAGDAFRRLPLPDAPLLRPGAPVTCLYGPFQGREAVVISAATNTARIAMPMLGALRELTVPIACLTARE